MSLRYIFVRPRTSLPRGNRSKEVSVTTLSSLARDSFWVKKLQGCFILFAQFICFTGPLPLLLIVIKEIQALSFDSRFSKVEPGDGVTGKVEENHLYITSDECIVRYVERTPYFLNLNGRVEITMLFEPILYVTAFYHFCLATGEFINFIWWWIWRQCP